MSHYKPYPAYKESGVEWIGQVPEHWRCLRFKRLAVICNGQDYKEVADPAGEIAVVGSGGEDDKDGEIGRGGYEINFNRYFYKYQPPRLLADIDAELKQVEAEIAALLGDVTE